jgi:hypothetical protein
LNAQINGLARVEFVAVDLYAASLAAELESRMALPRMYCSTCRVPAPARCCHALA